jgi:hypothetical protein
MDFADIGCLGDSSAVSDQTLKRIVEQGFFAAPGTLAHARSACAELIFAREIIQAQTLKIAELNGPLHP